MSENKTFNTFSEFYPFYRSEHSDRTCRRLHFIGSFLALFILGYVIYSGELIWIFPGLVVGYAFAWIGHFFFEHNKPATFQYPFYSFMGDWVMFKDMLTGKLDW
ncbi:MAG: DUF962 domain-containing protein [Cellvibrionaceae bacterium]